MVQIGDNFYLRRNLRQEWSEQAVRNELGRQVTTSRLNAIHYLLSLPAFFIPFFFTLGMAVPGLAFFACVMDRVPFWIRLVPEWVFRSGFILIAVGSLATAAVCFAYRKSVTKWRTQALEQVTILPPIQLGHHEDPYQFVEQVQLA